MCACPRILRVALCLAAAGWMAAGCARSPIDAERAAFVAPARTAARSAARARLLLAEDQARHGLSVAEGAAQRPTPSHGTVREAYLRWLRGEVKPLAGSGTGDGGK